MKFIMILICLAMQGCLSTGGGGPSNGTAAPKVDPPSTIYLSGEPVWRTLDDVKLATGSKGKLIGNVLDLMGCAISGKRIKHPKNSQDEKSLPLRIYIKGFTIRNGIIRDIPGGIVLMSDNCKLQDLLFIDPGEDYVSTPKDSAQSTEITRCKFYNRNGDKAGQLNDARKAKVIDCYFTGGQTALRIQESTSKSRGVTVTVTDCVFDDVPTGVNVDGYTTVTSSGNTFKGVAKKWVLGPHAKVINK